MLFEMNHQNRALGHIYTMKYNGTSFEFIANDCDEVIDFLPHPLDRNLWDMDFTVLTSYFVGIYIKTAFPKKHSEYDSCHNME